MEKREGKGCAVIHYECFTLEYSDNNVLNLVIDHNNGEKTEMLAFIGFIE